MSEQNERAAWLAQQFHEAYERLAPSFGYATREASRKPWADVPANNRALMTAVCAELLSRVQPDPPPPSASRAREALVAWLREIERTCISQRDASHFSQTQELAWNKRAEAAREAAALLAQPVSREETTAGRAGRTCWICNGTGRLPADLTDPPSDCYNCDNGVVWALPAPSELATEVRALRAWKESAMAQLAAWHAVGDLLMPHVRPGEDVPTALKARLPALLEQLRTKP
jgi:hypothetical protein